MAEEDLEDKVASVSDGNLELFVPKRGKKEISEAKVNLVSIYQAYPSRLTFYMKEAI